MKNKIVPLVTYENGERRVIGEAEVKEVAGHIDVIAHVLDQKFHPPLKDDGLEGFSLMPTPKLDIEIGMEWIPAHHVVLNSHNKVVGTVSIQDLIEMPSLPLITDIEHAMVAVAGQHYDATDLPMLDKAHETLGVGEQWQASARRAQIAGTQKDWERL